MSSSEPAGPQRLEYQLQDAQRERDILRNNVARLEQDLADTRKKNEDALAREAQALTRATNAEKRVAELEAKAARMETWRRTITERTQTKLNTLSAELEKVKREKEELEGRVKKSSRDTGGVSSRPTATKSSKPSHKEKPVIEPPKREEIGQLSSLGLPSPPRFRFSSPPQLIFPSPPLFPPSNPSASTTAAQNIPLAQAETQPLSSMANDNEVVHDGYNSLASKTRRPLDAWLRRKAPGHPSNASAAFQMSTSHLHAHHATDA